MKENDTKFQAKTPDFNTEAAKKIAELFPEVAPDGHIDVGALEDLLSPDLENEENNEKYEFTWRGKKEAKRIANAPTRNTTLIPVKEKSKNWDSTKNVYIEGDNLEALKLLQKAYGERIKMIYIDPPYNTGHDFVYKDNFHDSYRNYLKETGQLDEEGNANTTNKETNGRYHTDWLNMMYPRLKLGRNLLSEDGIIAVSIDEHEVANLRKIMDEIFGEINFMGQITTVNNPRGRSQDKYVATSSEYLLIYSKTVRPKGRLSVDKTAEDLGKDYQYQDEKGAYRILELRNTHRDFGKFNRPNLFYSFYVSTDGNVSLTKDNTHNIEVQPIWNDGFEGCWTWGKDKSLENLDLLVAKKNNEYWKIYRKSYADNATKQLKSSWNNKQFYTDKGQEEVSNLFNIKEKIFQAPKSVKYIKQILEMGINKDNDIILDFFSGSGTTAESVMSINKEQKTNLKYIMIQLPEKTSNDSVAYNYGYKTITDVAEERIRRAGEKYSDTNIDTGFKVFKLQKSTIKQWDDNPEMFQQQLEMIHSPFTQESTNDQRALEIAIKEGIDLSTSPIVQENNYHFVTDTKEVFVILGNYSENLLDALDKKRKLANATVVLKEMDSGSEIKFNLIEKLKQEPGLNDHFVLEWL